MAERAGSGAVANLERKRVMRGSGCIGERDYIKPEKARVKAAANPPKSGIHGTPGKHLKTSGGNRASYTAVPRPPGKR